MFKDGDIVKVRFGKDEHPLYQILQMICNEDVPVPHYEVKDLTNNCVYCIHENDLMLDEVYYRKQKLDKICSKMVN